MKNRKENFSLFFGDYITKLEKTISAIDINLLEQIVTLMIDAFKGGKTIYIVGNGGSAATASHIQADFSFFVRRFTKYRPKVIALTNCLPLITAIGNDISYDDIFVEQMKGHFEKSDVLISISASGNSKNIIKAAEYANKAGGISIAWVGFDGGQLKDISQITLHIPSKKGDYGPVEDVHMILNHIIVNYFAKDEEFLSIS
jgi:D-sedoheptulose 7-phosphate isomerase